MKRAIKYFINDEYEKFEREFDRTEDQMGVLCDCTDIACYAGDYNKIEILFNMFNKHQTKRSIKYDLFLLNLTLKYRDSGSLWISYGYRLKFTKENPLIFAYKNNNIKAIKCIIKFCNKHNIDISKILSEIVSRCIHNISYSILQLLINNLDNDFDNYSKKEPYRMFGTPDYCYYGYYKIRIKIELIVHNIMAQQTFRGAKMENLFPLMYLLIQVSNKAKKKIQLNYGPNMIYFLQTNNKIFI